MARFEVFIPAAASGGFDLTLRVDAENWMAALKAGLGKLGEQGAQVGNILVDILDDNSMRVTEVASGRVFHIREQAAAPPQEATPAPEAARPPPAPEPPPAPAAQAHPAPAEGRRPPAAKAPPPVPPAAHAEQPPRVPPAESASPPLHRPEDREQEEELLAALFERVRALEEMKPDAAMDFLLDLALETIPADAGSVFLSDRALPELALACARGPKAAALRSLGLRLPVGVGIVGFCAREAVSLAIRDTHKDPRFYREVSEKIGYPTRSILCAPMVVGGRTFGCLELINKKDSSHFTRTELAALAYLAHQGARYLERQ